MRPEIKIEEDGSVYASVRSIVDFILRSGDLGASGGVSAKDGETAHKVREDGSGRALNEVSLSYDTVYGGVSYHISGRADIIIPSESETGDDIIEEIKTVASSFYGSASNIPAAHIAQAVMYAFMWCREKGRRRAVIRITYMPKSSGRERRFECLFSYEELATEVGSIIAELHEWVRFLLYRRGNPQRIKNLRFPYGAARPGQKDFMEAVMRCARTRSRVMIQAPTGIGKTMASLFPAVKSVGVGYTDRIFYLTAKGSNAIAAEGASSEIIGRVGGLLGVTLVSRERICPMVSKGGSASSVPSCSADFCPLAKGHYDRINGALCHLLFGRSGHITAEDILKEAKASRVCPYELSLEISDFADIIICDYNYVFDKGSSLKRFFSAGEENTHRGERYMLLLDEAHNLVSRSRDMYSAKISEAELVRVISLIGSEYDELSEELGALRGEISKVRGLCGENLSVGADGEKSGYYKTDVPFLGVAAAAAKCVSPLRFYLYMRKKDGMRSEDYALISSFASSLHDFSVSADLFDRRFTAIAEVGHGQVTVSHICLDASAILSERFALFASAVLFSATLEPPDYFIRVLGCGDKCESLELPSPYDEENLSVIIADKISTRFPDRAASAPMIAELVRTVATSHTGNYICYLPSYKYLTMVADTFSELFGGEGIEVTAERRTMRRADRAEFLSGFVPSPAHSHVGFCVLGGAFSEGVDLSGDRLSGAIIVGVGLPGISSELNLLAEYYERLCERGQEFAYIFPGMNKVLQAAGRVIRSERDRGIVLLIDDRFATAQYRELFPVHWRDLKLVGDAPSLGRVLRRFWEEK